MNSTIIKLPEELYNRIVSVKDFKEDFSVGKIGEFMAKQYLEQKGLKFIRESEDKSELKKWDLEYEHKNKLYRYEVKNDVYIIPSRKLEVQSLGTTINVPGRDTGNIFIEYHSRNVPSGISTTTADYWMNFFFHLNELWIIDVNKLKHLIENNDYVTSEESGDFNSHTKGYLIPRNQYRENFKVVKYERILI